MNKTKIPIILIQLFLLLSLDCRNVLYCGNVTGTLRNPMLLSGLSQEGDEASIDAERVQAALSAEAVKQRLSELIGNVVGEPLEAVVSIVKELNEDVLHRAWVRRFNLDPSFFSVQFIEKWRMDKNAALELLAKGYVTSHRLGPKGELIISFNELPEELRAELSASLNGKMIYKSPKTRNITAYVEWAWFPSLGKWLPVQVTADKARNPTFIKTVLGQDGVVKDVGAHVGKVRLEKLEGCRLCMRVASDGHLAIGTQKLKGRLRGFYTIAEQSDNLVIADIGHNGVPISFRFMDRDAPLRLKVIGTKEKDGTVRFIESHILLDTNTLKALTDELGSFWVFHDTERKRFKIGAKEFSGTAAEDRPPWVDKYLKIASDNRTYTMLITHEFQLPLSMTDTSVATLMIRGVPAYIQRGSDQGVILKRIETMPDDGSSHDIINAYIDDVPSTGLLNALAHAAQRMQKVAVTRLHLVLSEKERGACYIVVAGQRIYVPAGLFEQVLLKLPQYAEVVYDPKQVKYNEETQEAVPIPVEVRLGRYTTDNPYELSECKFEVVAKFSLAPDPDSPGRFVAQDPRKLEIREGLANLGRFKSKMKRLIRKGEKVVIVYGQETIWDPARKVKDKVASLAENIVRYGTSEDAEKYLSHFVEDLAHSKASQLGVMYFASSVGTYGRAEHLRLLEGLLDNLTEYARTSEEASDALRFATYAFALRGNRECLEKLKSLLPKLIPYISTFEIQDAVYGISEAIARYGTKDDVRFYLSFFESMSDEQANANIYHLALNISEYGSREMLLPLLGLRLQPTWANYESRPFSGLADCVSAIGIACLAKGDEDDIRSYARLFINPLPEKEARAMCYAIADHVVRNEGLAIYVNTYLAKLAPNLDDEKRKAAILKMAFLVADNGNSEHVREYLKTFAATLNNPRSQGAIWAFMFFMHKHGGINQMDAVIDFINYIEEGDALSIPLKWLEDISRFVSKRVEKIGSPEQKARLRFNVYGFMDENGRIVIDIAKAKRAKPGALRDTTRGATSGAELNKVDAASSTRSGLLRVPMATNSRRLRESINSNLLEAFEAAVGSKSKDVIPIPLGSYPLPKNVKQSGTSI